MKNDEQALEYLLKAVEKAGYKPGEDVSFALDAAAGEWRTQEHYYLPKRDQSLSQKELKARYDDLTRRFPIISIEDPFGEEDFDAFSEITREIGNDIMIVGDDLFTTNPLRLENGIHLGAANALLIKPNQVGTVSETLEAIAIARTELCCTLEDVCSAAAWLLPTGAPFYLVHKPERLAEIFCAASRHKLEPKRLFLMRYKEDGPVSLVLIQCRKGAKPGLIWEEAALHTKDGSFTEYYRKLYHL